MEKAYFDQNRREHELVTRLSLRLDFPLAFLQLKATGACEIEIPEWRLDREYPGHYLRRIKTVSLTIPCVAGPYTGVHCKLTLLSSATRVEPTLLDVEECCPGRVYVRLLRAPALRGDQGRSAHREALRRDRSDRHVHGAERRRTVRAQFPRRALPAVRVRGGGQSLADRAADRDERVRHRHGQRSDLPVELHRSRRRSHRCERRAGPRHPACCPGAGLRFFDWRQDFADAWQRFKAARAGCRATRIAHARSRCA